MTARARVLVGVTCALWGATSIAAAKPRPMPDPQFNVDPLSGAELVVATDPVGNVGVQVVGPEAIDLPGPEPYGLPPTPPRPTLPAVPRESIVVLAAATQAWMSERDGLGTLGRGGVLSLAFLQRHGKFPSGAELSGVFLRGERASVYDLSMRMLGSPKIGRRKAVPFVAIGMVVGASRLVTDQAKVRGQDVGHGFAIGPSAAVGLHGFLGDKTYWRAGAGYLGAGLGAYTADLGLGIVVD